MRTKSTPIHCFNRKQRGNMPGRGGSGNGRASHVGQRNSFRTNRIASRLAPACRRARANSVGCGCPRLRCCRKSVLSQFRRPPPHQVPVVRLEYHFKFWWQHLLPVTSGHLREVHSQHSVLVARIIDRRFGLEHLEQLVPGNSSFIRSAFLRSPVASDPVKMR